MGQGVPLESDSVINRGAVSLTSSYAVGAFQCLSEALRLTDSSYSVLRAFSSL
jgi:hypothetical protein